MIVLAAGDVTQEALDFLFRHGAMIYTPTGLDVYLVKLPETARRDNYWGVASIYWFDEDAEHTRTEGIEVMFEENVLKTSMRYVSLLQIAEAREREEAFGCYHGDSTQRPSVGCEQAVVGKITGADKCVGLRWKKGRK